MRLLCKLVLCFNEYAVREKPFIPIILLHVSSPVSLFITSAAAMIDNRFRTHNDLVQPVSFEAYQSR
jgi:hypothetical protein